MLLQYDRKNIVACSLFFVALLVVISFFYYLTPVAAEGETAETVFVVNTGDGFRDIRNKLFDAHLIRSRTGFTVLAFSSGRGWKVKPGAYRLTPSMSSMEILRVISEERGAQVIVTIPEGMTSYEIDVLLAHARVIAPGTFGEFARANDLEGKLFPDTYHFFLHSAPKDVVDIFLANFEEKTASLLPQDAARAHDALILASLLESEVPEYKDRRIVAGLLKKRIEARMPLQVDATICYIKEREGISAPGTCHPLTPLDFTYDSPYNTYMRRGLPPAPIGNPGTLAIKAALDPERSVYWFYLSDPKTRKTIFSETLDEHAQNRVKYLGIR